MNKKKLTCIVCPLGCQMEAIYDSGAKKIISVEGNLCKKGKKFTENEIIDPRRILTTTIRINSKKIKRLPVRSNIPAPKDKILKMVKEAKKIKAIPPIKMGDILAYNFLDSGVDIISSTTVDK
jgi:CxxC motif-containing protein